MKLIIGFSIPLLFGFLFQQFYSLVDTLIVGRILGVNALASVGATGSINFMIIGFCMGICNGFALPIAHRFGAGDYSGMRKAVANSLWLSILFAGIMTLVVSLLCRQILIWMKTPEAIIDDSYRYILVIFLGIPVTFLYNILSGIIRSLGDSKTPLIFLTIASVLNIILDWVCIKDFSMGVQGAAVATVISQGVSGILCLIYIRKKFEILRISKEEWKIDPPCMLHLCSMAIPMGLQYSITAIGSVILQSAVNGLGATVVASMTAGSKISMFFCCPFDALGSAIATYGGQNTGAKKMDRIDQGLKSAGFIGIIYAVIAFAILSTFGKYIAYLFIDPSETEILSNVSKILFFNSAFFIPLAFVNILRFLIQGMGFSKFAMFAGVFEMVARMIMGFVFVPKFGFIAACLASPVAWVMADLFLFPAYHKVKKQLETLFSQESAASL